MEGDGKMLIAYAYLIGSYIRQTLQAIKKFVVAAAPVTLVVLWATTMSVALLLDGMHIEHMRMRPQVVVVYVQPAQVPMPAPDPESTLITRYCRLATDDAGVPVMLTSDGVLVLASGWHGNMTPDTVVRLNITTHVYHVIDNGSVHDYSVRTVHVAMPTYTSVPPAPCGT